MKKSNRRGFILFSLCTALLLSTSMALAEGKLYPDPVEPPFAGFKPHELAFQTPQDGVARAEYKSQPFYAIILQTTQACSVTEKERLAVQALFPKNKVFTTRFGCDGNVEEYITYTNVKPGLGFIAVYAGLTHPEAEQFLQIVKTTGRFSGANIRKMQVVLVYP